MNVGHTIEYPNMEMHVTNMGDRSRNRRKCTCRVQGMNEDPFGFWLIWMEFCKVTCCWICVMMFLPSGKLT